VCFTRPVADIIRARSSWRSFDGARLAGDTRGKLETFMAGQTTGPFGGTCRFTLTAASGIDPEELKQPGTYGVIRGAAGFIVGAVKNGGRDMEEYGFLMEKIILRATDLGLGTCWLGGSFDRSAFSEAIGAGVDETVPAVSPVGYPAGKRRLLDSFIRWSAGSKKRKPWRDIFFYDAWNTGLTPEASGSYSGPLEMVRLAPSASNKQPWRVVMEKGHRAFHFHLERDPKYTKGLGRMGRADLQRIDMGIAFCHFELAAREMGCAGSWESQDPGLEPLNETTEYIASWIPVS